jgi:hypothetical protein
LKWQPHAFSPPPWARAGMDHAIETATSEAARIVRIGLLLDQVERERRAS